MLTLDLDKKDVINSLEGFNTIKYSDLEKFILCNFFNKILGDSLREDGYNNKEIEEFINNYIKSFDSKSLVNI